MVTTVDAITTPVPSRTDPVNFAARGDQFLGELPVFQSQINALAGELNVIGATAENAIIASAAAVTAANYKGNWNAGSTYAVGDSVTDEGFEYQNKVDDNQGVKPNTDPTKWKPVITDRVGEIKYTFEAPGGTWKLCDGSLSPIADADGTFAATLNDAQKFVYPGKLTDPSFSPVTLKDVDWTDNSSHVVYADEGSPFLYVFRRDGEILTKLDDPSSLPPLVNNISACGISGDGGYVAIGGASGDKLAFYKIVSDVISKLTNPATMPASVASISWTSTGTYCAIGGANTEPLMIYKRTADTLTKLSAPSTEPTTACSSVVFSQDDSILAAYGTGDSGTLIYDRTGDVFDYVETIASINVRSMSADGEYIAGIGSTDSFDVLKRIDGVYVSLLAPDYPTDVTSITDVAISPDAKNIVIVGTDAPYIARYRIVNDKLVKLNNEMDDMPSAGISCATFSGDNNFLSAGLSTYKPTNYDETAYFRVPYIEPVDKDGLTLEGLNAYLKVGYGGLLNPPAQWASGLLQTVGTLAELQGLGEGLSVGDKREYQGLIYALKDDVDYSSLVDIDNVGYFIETTYSATAAWVTSTQNGINLNVLGADSLGVEDATEVKDKAYALAALLGGGKVVWGYGGDSYLVSVSTEFVDPSVDTDLNGCNITANTCTEAGNLGSPIIFYDGGKSASYDIDTALPNAFSVTLSNSSDLADFAAGDWILIEDNIPVAKWDASGTAYNGRNQIAQIEYISAPDTLHLSSLLDYGFSVDPVIYKLLKFEKSPKITGGANVVQVDPGSATDFSGNPQQDAAPHLFRFRHCFKPTIETPTITGWQSHAIDFDRCWQPHIYGGSTISPFRPSQSGHGYTVRFHACHHGLAENIYAYGIRHLVDHNKSYDCVSRDCVSYDSVSYDFYCHGLGSLRCKSIDDSVFGTFDENDGKKGLGWRAGSDAFSYDHDYNIIRPKYRGGSSPFTATALAERMRVIDPDCYVYASRVFTVRMGATGTEIIGGRVIMHPTSNDHSLVYGLSLPSGGGVSLPVDGIRVDGVTVTFTNGAVGRIISGAFSGDIYINCNSTGGGENVLRGQLNDDNGDPVAQGVVELKGRYDSCSNVVQWSATPADMLEISVKSKGFTARLLNAAPIDGNGDLIIRDCDTFGAANFLPSGVGSTEVNNAVSAGALVQSNRPSTFDVY